MQQALDIVKNKFPYASYSLNGMEKYIIERRYNVDNIVLSIITSWVRAGHDRTTKRMIKRMSTGQLDKNFVIFLGTYNYRKRELLVDVAIANIGMDMARLRGED